MKKPLNEIYRIFGHRQGFDFSCYDDSFLQKTVEKRVSATGIGTAAAYFTHLSDNTSEQDILYNSLSISYSEFFRNPLTFILLEQQLLPTLMTEKQKNGQAGIRVWSAGCAAGQEAYSIAILLDELTAGQPNGTGFSIFATDRCHDELASALQGSYDFAAVRNVPLRHIRKYFVETDGTFRISDSIKKLVDFSQHDLTEAGYACPPASIYGDFDVVFCSNLLFYYRPEIRQLILDKVFKSLAPGGYLVTGEAEKAIVEKHKGFSNVIRQSAIYRKSAQR